MKNQKKLDKFIYIIIKILGIFTISIIFYFITYVTMSMMNSSEFSKILINLQIYSFFYRILNFLNSLFIPILLIVALLAIPYLIVSIVIGIIFIIKYVKCKEKNKGKFIKILLLAIISAFAIIGGAFSYPMTNVYEIKVNSNINDISNTQVREFLQSEFTKDVYVNKIVFIQGFPDDYDVEIYYKKDNENLIEKTFLSDSNYDFIHVNAQKITSILEIKSIVITLIGSALYVYLFKLSLKEFVRLSKRRRLELL